MTDFRSRYPSEVVEPLRFESCPLCREPLGWSVPLEDGIERPVCTACGWIHGLRNAVGVVSVVRSGDDVAVVEPPGRAGVALPAGLVEYGESPEAGALREILEETGLEAEIVRSLGWEFVPSQEWPGPQVMFFYEATVTGGALKGSAEGRAMYVPLSEVAARISPDRTGSRRAIEIFMAEAGRA